MRLFLIDILFLMHKFVYLSTTFKEITHKDLAVMAKTQYILLLLNYLSVNKMKALDKQFGFELILMIILFQFSICNMLAKLFNSKIRELALFNIFIYIHSIKSI